MTPSPHPARAPVTLTRAEPTGAWKTTAAYATLYLLTATLGRVFQEDRISVLWPAAGILVLWALARSRAAHRWVDLGLVAVLGAVAALLTGGTAVEAVALAAGQVAQLLVSAGVLGGSGTLRAGLGRRALRHVEDLWLLVAAALLGSVASALASQLALELGHSGLPWASVLPRAVRNTASVLVIVPVALALVEWAQTPPRTDASRRGRLRIGRLVEHTTALAMVPLTYAAWFLLEDVPLIFPLLVLTVWAGARLRTWFVLLHDTTAAVAAVAFTLAGAGPFVTVGVGWIEVVLAQLYVGIVCTIGLALALARDERVRLARDATRARDAAQAQAELLSTVVDTMAEGVSVVGPDGRILLRNPRASELLGPERTAVGEVGTGGAHGLLRLDDSPLPDADLPYRRALAGEPVRDLLLRRWDDASGESRTLAFNSTPLPHGDRGVVTIVRDVTVERRELEHAAQVQARLFPQDSPRVPGYEVAARAVSAGMVGGDFYDWVLADERLTLVLADVMGKGLGAAILAATARTALRTRADDGDLGPAVTAAEQAVDDDLRRTGAFVTAFVARLDPRTHHLEYVDAGHGLAFVARKATGHVERLAATGPPLGVLTGLTREARRLTLDPGDLVVAVSDGMLDALGGAIGDLAAVEAVLRDDGGAQDVVTSLLALVPSDAHLPDDVTVVVLHRHLEEPAVTAAVAGPGER